MAKKRMIMMVPRLLKIGFQNLYGSLSVYGTKCSGFVPKTRRKSSGYFNRFLTGLAIHRTDIKFSANGRAENFLRRMERTVKLQRTCQGVPSSLARFLHNARISPGFQNKPIIEAECINHASRPQEAPDEIPHEGEIPSERSAEGRALMTT